MWTHSGLDLYLFIYAKSIRPSLDEKKMFIYKYIFSTKLNKKTFNVGLLMLLKGHYYYYYYYCICYALE